MTTLGGLCKVLVIHLHPFLKLLFSQVALLSVHSIQML